LGKQPLHDRLREVDPATAARLHPNDVRRVVRALEVWHLTGQPISAFQQTWDTEAPPAAIPCVVLEWPREELYRRIDARVNAMLAAGWLEEVRRLPQSLSKEAAQALGYRELLAHLNGTGPGWAETVSLIQTRTRQFAKRQLTWFRHLPGCQVCPADAPATVDRVLQLWASAARSICGKS
jgi:tRNA dimethylallyltransferase